MNRYKLSKAGIDANEGIHRFNNKKEIYEKFLYEFLEDTHYKDMLAAIERQDAEKAFQQAHALKGITGNLSINQLHKALIPAVEILRKHSLDGIEGTLQPIQEAYELVMEALRQDCALKEE